MSTSVLITDSFSAEALSHLRSGLSGLTHETRLLKSQATRPTSQELRDCEVLLIRSRTKIDSQLLASAPTLKLIVTATAGFDHIDLAACRGRGIQVAYTPEANAQSAAELTLALMLMLVRRLPPALNSLARGGWREEHSRGHEVHGKTLGIIGLGQVGQRVAKMARGFGLNVLAYDPYQGELAFQDSGAARVGISELFVAADILSLHVPLTRETHHLLNHSTLRLLNSEAYLLNCSRGAVIEESDLLAALEEGLFQGVALDVFEREPLAKDSRLRQHERVILTPHIGAFTHEAIERASMLAAEQALRFLRGERVAHTLPLPVPWFDKVLGFES